MEFHVLLFHDTPVVRATLRTCFVTMVGMAVPAPSFPARLNPSKLVLGFFASFTGFLTFCATAAVLRDYADHRVKPPSLLAEVALGFGVLTFFLAKDLFDRTPLLQVDERGIRSKHEGYGLIEWKEIAGVRLWEPKAAKVTLTSFLIVVPKNGRGILDCLPTEIRERADKALSKYGGLPINIQNLPFPPKALVEAIQAYSVGWIGQADAE
jgi:hypothetical protein